MQNLVVATPPTARAVDLAYVLAGLGSQKIFDSIEAVLSSPNDRLVIRVRSSLSSLALFGWKKIPAGDPSGLWMTSPDAGDAPNFIAASSKYSKLSALPNGEGGAGWLLNP